MLRAMGDSIEHVVLLMLENHSFDQMLGGMQRAIPGLDGVDPAAPGKNMDALGRPYLQRVTTRLQVSPDPKHEHADVMRQIAGDNGGFVTDYLLAHGERARPGCEQVMGYFEAGFLPALHVLAREFAVCDRWFASVPGPTWPNRFFALSGTSNGRVLMPESIGHMGMLYDQTQTTLFDRLNEAGRTWNVFFYDFAVSLLLEKQRGKENLARYSPIDDFFARASGDPAAFPELALIEPGYFGLAQNDDHPPHNVMKAQKLVADVYNAIRSNDALWERTLLAVVYDEHGGFYDHVPPPAAVPPDAHAEEYAFDRLGVRVPAVLVSPWIDRQIVHTTFDHTSLLAFLTEKWKLGPLGARTAKAETFAAAIGRKAPRRDTPRFLRVPNADLVPERADWERSDKGRHHEALHLVAEAIQREIDGAGAATIEELARLSSGVGAWERALAWAWDRVGAVAHAMRGPLARAEGERVRRTEETVKRAVRGGGG
jgi:phospholipase C